MWVGGCPVARQPTRPTHLSLLVSDWQLGMEPGFKPSSSTLKPNFRFLKEEFPPPTETWTNRLTPLGPQEAKASGAESWASSLTRARRQGFTDFPGPQGRLGPKSREVVPSCPSLAYRSSSRAPLEASGLPVRVNAGSCLSPLPVPPPGGSSPSVRVGCGRGARTAGTHTGGRRGGSEGWEGGTAGALT